MLAMLGGESTAGRQGSNLESIERAPGSVPCDALICRWSEGDMRCAPAPACLCAPLHVFMLLLSSSDASSITHRARVTQSSACSVWFDRRRDARAAKHPHEACMPPDRDDQKNTVLAAAAAVRVMGRSARRHPRTPGQRVDEATPMR
ncbi:hypothetical protein Q7P35_002693 [Cladosporium inversicolor]